MMGRYYKLSEKVSGVIRPVLPKKFILKDGRLLWDDTDAVYDAGMIESSENGVAWDAFTIFLPDEEKVDALSGKFEYRMRVKYNSHWSIYLRATEVKPVVAEESELVPLKSVVKPRTTKAKK